MTTVSDRTTLLLSHYRRDRTPTRLTTAAAIALLYQEQHRVGVAALAEISRLSLELLMGITLKVKRLPGLHQTCKFCKSLLLP